MIKRRGGTLTREYEKNKY